MKPLDHLIKAHRMSVTMKKLDFEEDCETIITMSGLAATSLVNAALHVTGMLGESENLTHANYYKRKIYKVLPFKWEDLDASTEKALKTALSTLYDIELLRPTHVRGEKISDSAAKVSLEAYKKIKEQLAAIIL